MTVTLAQIRADLGEGYSAVDNGTTSVKAVLERAQNRVIALTGTTTGYDSVTRPLVDSMICNHLMAGIDPVNKTIGTLSVGSKDMASARNYFTEEAKRACVIKGYSLDGLTMLFKDSEDS